MELPNYSRQLLQQVYTLCKEQQFCDCTIFVGTLHFRAHKLVLSAASLLFKSLLETTETISIDSSVVSPEEFSLLLEMMYSGKLPPGKHNLTKIISVADSLQMFDVAVSCKNLLTELMNHSTQSQKVKDVSIKPLTLGKPEARPAVPRSNVVSETFAIDKMLLPMNTGGMALASTPEQREADKVSTLTSSSKKLDTNGNLHTSNPAPPKCSAEQVKPQQGSKGVKEKEDCVTGPSHVARPPSPAQIDATLISEGLDEEHCPAKDETVPCVQPIHEESTDQLVSETVVEEETTDSAIEETCTGTFPESTEQDDKLPQAEESAEPAAKKRRLDKPESEKASGELDFLIRYESIFSEALSDPQSVLENLKKCDDIKEAEKQVVMECCQAEEGSSTFAKLLEKVKDGQSIVVETVLALLKLCRDTNPSVNEALLEKEPQSKDPVKEVAVDTGPLEPVEREKTLFDLLMERREELIQCITELSPIIECLDTAEEGFLTNIEKKVITDCCECGSHKEAMDKMLRKASETKTLCPDSLVKLLQAVREAFPDLHTLLDQLEPHSKKSNIQGKLSAADYGAELLKQYQENFSEVVNEADVILGGISTALYLTDHEKEMMEQIVRKNCNTRIFGILIFTVFEEQTLPAMAVWQLLLAMEELSPAVRSLMEEVRKEPGADVFFQSVLNRENEVAEILIHHSSLIAQAFRQCEHLSSLASEDEALSDLLKELLSIQDQPEDGDLSSKMVLSAALQNNIPVMKFCHLLCTAKDSAPELKPVFKDLEQNGLLVDGKCNFHSDDKWNDGNDCHMDAVEEIGDRNEEDEEAKDDENEEMDSEKERVELAQEKGSKKNFICKSCDKIFLFRCRLEVHMKRCRMAKRNPLQCKDCNVVQASKKELDQHREEVHGYLISRNNKGKRRMLVTCDICGKEFAHPSGLQYHKRTEHFDEKPFSCEECGAKFAANSTLKNHQRLHTGERPFVCKHCHMTFTQAAALSYHTKKKHSEGKMYVCQYCDAVFAQSIELTRHVRTHTGDKPYVCRECGKGFSQANGLSIHLRTFHNIEDPYDCQKCRMSFPTLEENRQHIQVVHSKEYHPCPSCEKIFSAPSLLERHIVTHVGGKPYNCDICDKAYQQLSGLWYHNRTHHPDLFAAQNHRSSKFSAAQCSSCEQVFSNTSTLQKHTKLEHPDGKVYECDKCKQTYPTPAALQVHIKCKHSGSQPFQCLYCSECFQFPGALQHHVATNHFNETENTFGCELCGELFTSQTQLETHYESDHPSIVIEETEGENAQVVQVIQTQDQVTATEQVITLDESQLAGSQVIVALPDSQTNQATATELVAVSMEDLFDGTVTLICGDPVPGVTQRTQS
ncbi:PREDICTED: zinc finger and BTB domain-containing protein 40 [Nanorana parkeri]|uniref:zinc finger and BTB domain-containing protein 40 n=1 Tax=Nanorana parkeri TaxID=125878 RepID=UPI00085473CB|nr:PREDICTED: zinc finger and BTB domain-containing protein 40 [Nanorana parkeri]